MQRIKNVRVQMEKSEIKDLLSKNRYHGMILYLNKYGQVKFNVLE